MHTQEPPSPRAPRNFGLSAIGGGAGARGREAVPRETTFEEERREVAASVLDALAGNAADPDEMAVCSYLLKHLSQTGDRRAPSAF